MPNNMVKLNREQEADFILPKWAFSRRQGTSVSCSYAERSPFYLGDIMPKGIPLNGINKGWFKKGHLPTNGFKKGMVSWSKGQHPECLQGKNHPMFGKHHTIKVRKLLSLKHKGKHLSESTKQKLKIIAKEKGFGLWMKNRKGAETNNWKGGITYLYRNLRKSALYRDWRIAVFKKDSFTCQKCLKKGHNLEAHHIKSFYDVIKINDIRTSSEAINCKELWDMNNGITLCKNCHRLNKEKL